MPRVPSCLTCLRAFRPLLRTYLHFFTRLTCLQLFTHLTCPHFLRALHALIFYVLYVPSFFTCLDFFSCLACPLIFTWLRILRTYILFMHMLIKLTQINELTDHCSSLLLLNSVIYNVSSIIFCMVFSFFKTKNFYYFYTIFFL